MKMKDQKQKFPGGVTSLIQNRESADGRTLTWTNAQDDQGERTGIFYIPKNLSNLMIGLYEVLRECHQS